MAIRGHSADDLLRLGNRELLQRFAARFAAGRGWFVVPDDGGQTSVFSPYYFGGTVIRMRLRRLAGQELVEMPISGPPTSVRRGWRLLAARTASRGESGRLTRQLRSTGPTRARQVCPTPSDSVAVAGLGWVAQNDDGPECPTLGLPLGHDVTSTTGGAVTAVGDQRRASVAYAMGDLGGWARERYAPEVVDRDDDDFAPPDEAAAWVPWWVRLRGRAIRWSLAAGVFLAYVHHWPGGH